METEFLELMPHTVTLEAPDGTYSDRGQPNYAAGVSYSAYVEPAKGEDVVRLDSGEVRKASYKIYLNATARIDAESRLTLPSGYVPQQPPILSVALFADESGGHHVELVV